MSTMTRFLDFLLTGCSLAVAGSSAVEFVTGFGYGGNGFLVQAGLAAVIGASSVFAWDSTGSWAKGITSLPREIMDRMRSRPFARSLTESLPGILSLTSPQTSAHPALIDPKDGSRRRLKTVFDRQGTFHFNETIRHEGKTIEVAHDHDGSIRVSVKIDRGDEKEICESLDRRERQMFARTLEETRIAAFADLLRCEAHIDSISVHIGLRLPEASASSGTYALEDDPEGLKYILLRSSSDDDTSDQVLTSWIMHPRIGYLMISHEIIDETLENRRDHLLLAAFDETVDPISSMPVITGNPVAAKEISIARKLIARYPRMKDASGTPIAPLVEEHLPRLLRIHAEAIESATATDEIDEAKLKSIQGDFDEGLAVITRAILEGLEAEQKKTRDDLSVEIRFLEARHPSPGVLTAA